MKKRTYTEIELNNKELKEAIIKQLNKDGIKVKSDNIELSFISDLFDSGFGGSFSGGFNYSTLNVTITLPKENKIKSIKSFDLFKPKQKWVTKAIVNYLKIENDNSIEIKYGNFGLEGIGALVTKTKKAKKSTKKK